MVLAAMVFLRQQSVTTPVGKSFRSPAIPIGFESPPDLAPLLALPPASPLFAIALLASGQAGTITGTLAGQVVMEGSCTGGSRHGSGGLVTAAWRFSPRCSSSDCAASSVNDLPDLSQVVLALQLPLAMFPLLHFTSSRRRMGIWKMGVPADCRMDQRAADYRHGPLRTSRLA